MSTNYEIGLAINDDIPAIVAIQEPNLHENGGGLSVRQNADWFRHGMAEMPIVVARRDGLVVGYALATSVAAKSHVAIVQTMLRAFPAPPNCYLYGPVCVTESERENSLAAMMYQEMRARLPGRTAMFRAIRQRAVPQGDRKMGKKNSANSCMMVSTTSCSHLPVKHDRRAAALQARPRVMIKPRAPMTT